MHYFYTPFVLDDSHTLNPEESRHCIKVLRKKVGQHIEIVDGQGGIYKGTIIQDHPKKCELKIVSKEKKVNPLKIHLHLAVAPTKNNDRFEWFLEKATEIGISEITPIICSHSERKVIKIERMKNILVSAMKQSNRCYLPLLNEAILFEQFITKDIPSHRYIAHCHDVKKQHLQHAISKGQNTLVMIGPEGDFSETEIQIAKQHGFKDVTLASSRLRTETAAVVACHTLNLINQ